MPSININIPPIDRRTNEAFKTLRMNLQLCGKDKQSIAVTSCMQSEGKTTISMNLAKSLAELGNRVLYIDADLRKSVVLSRCQITERIRGLSEFLSGQVSFSDIVYITNVRNLHMVFAGPTPPNPAEQLNSAVFANVVQKLKQGYDYIIIDTPPLGSVIDAAVVANVTDCSVLVVTANHISRKFVKKVVDQLNKAESPLLGIILNKVDMKNSIYGRYYGKYYGKEDKYLNE